MQLGFENRKQAITAAIFAPLGLWAIIYLVMQFIPSTPSAPQPQPTTASTPTTAPATQAAIPAATQNSSQNAEHHAYANSEVATATSPLDPTLHPEIMFAAEHLEYTGNGRNIFSPNSAPPVVVNIPKPIASARPITVAAPVNQGPPPPPPLPFKLFGVEARSDGTPFQVFLLRGEDVFMAREGDIVMRQYKVTRITANSVEMEDLPHNNKQVLPLIK
jgi:hypothetical protein